MADGIADYTRVYAEVANFKGAAHGVDTANFYDNALVNLILPRAHSRFVCAANRHSSDLREEFVRLPPARIAAVLIVSVIVLAGAALATTRSVAASAVSGAAPVLFAGLLIRWYRNRRKRSILSQSPVRSTLLSGHVRAWDTACRSPLRRRSPCCPPESGKRWRGFCSRIG